MCEGAVRRLRRVYVEANCGLVCEAPEGTSVYVEANCDCVCVWSCWLPACVCVTELLASGSSVCFRQQRVLTHAAAGSSTHAPAASCWY